MAALVSARSVSAFYRELWASVHEAPAPVFLADNSPLPPFLCRSLAFGSPSLPDDCSWLVAMTGSPDGELLQISTASGDVGFHWGVANIAPTLYDYAAIDGHSVIGFSSEHKTLFEEALALIGDLGGTYLDTVRDFIGLVLWLEADPTRTDVVKIISSSFPTLPHCVVVTDSAAKGVLPNEKFEAFSAWAMAESLYHESLHQVLSATILQDEIFVDSFHAAAGPTIHAEWRNADWPLDRSLHALFVYANITRMRRRLLDLDRFGGSERDILTRVHDESASATALLGGGLEAHRAIFTEPGNRLLSELQNTL